MGKFIFGNGQYVVYAKSEQEARKIISQELRRFDSIREQMSSLLTANGQEWQRFMDNSSEDGLNIYFNDEQSAIYDVDTMAKGEVRQRNLTNGRFLYDLAYRYPNIEGHNADFRLAHEMGHLMLNPSNTNQQSYDAKSNSRQIAGLIRRDESTGKLYGEQIQENAINLIAQLAIRGGIKADDIITGKSDLSEFNLYKRCDDLVKLLAVSMRNDFEREMTFEQLAEQKIDSMIIHSDGTQEPANTFFYGILNDSSIVENEFDKYLGKGAWKELNEAFAQLHDPNLSKDRFDLIFQNAQGLIKEFSNIRYKEKYKEAVLRNRGFNVPGLADKLYLIDEMTEGRTNEENDFQIPEEETSDVSREIISTDSNESQIQNPNKLTLKQKIALFFKNNGIFKHIEFMDKFIHKQLDELPSTTQKVQEKNNAKENFINQLTNFGEYRHLPQNQAIADTQKLENMRKAMNQKQKSDEENYK